MESAEHRHREAPQGASSQPSDLPEDNAQAPVAAPAVRFASKVEQFAPDGSQSRTEPTKNASSPGLQPPNITPEQMRALSQSLADTNLQEQRMKSFSYQPFSLPASRVPSHESSANATPQQSHTPTGRHSPRMGAAPDVVSPPLTPSGTSAHEAASGSRLKPVNAQADGAVDISAITPQASGQGSLPVSPRIALPHRPASYDPVSQKPSDPDEREGARSSQSHRAGMFSVGPGGRSVPVSRETSPSRKTASQYYSRPFTPAGDVNDPYAASKRAPPTRSAANIDSRFVFSRKKGRGSPGSSSVNLTKPEKFDKRHSGFLGVLNKSSHDLQHTGTESSTHSRNASMSDLKRFFKVGGGHKAKKSESPMPSEPRPSLQSRSSYQVPFADDHGLTSKYGKIGRVLGSGAGGSVKLMRRHEDNTVFAVKEFRPRHTYESEKEYVKKLTAEFCIGSALHHGNVIETLDIVSEKGKWYEVMEYAPYDLFAIVMTGKMSKPEVACCFLQILNGVTYLHSMGLAHRDLKLDNVVVSEHGIMKIIDFGSAHVFKYPFEGGIVPATGIVGSDPYLAPEVYDERKYDPQAVDIWSLAIIFCCMSLRRFPWKVPRMTDNSYKLFAAEPTPGHDPKKLILPARSMNDLTSIPQRDMFPENDSRQQKEGQSQGPQKAEKSETSQPNPSTVASSPTSKDSTSKDAPATKEVIRGPWRLLRLLPRESRHIIGRMLTIDPRQRATMQEILDEPWVSDTVICRQDAPGKVDPAHDHTHILEPPASQSK
ncbi:putative Kinase-like domain-containing protein [Seiridium unicorne]|uniref:non-specific serine/threonine protein kinase n=1 Tax=Seiridium unicorne TaxID=138068 RepID=A0ABR2V634_9PEZI